jgi:hypothetical protein
MTTSQVSTREAAVKFVEAPPPGQSAKGGRPSKWAPVVAALKANPGQWALLVEGGRTVGSVSMLRRDYGITVRTRKRADGRFDIYGCWDGAA